MSSDSSRDEGPVVVDPGCGRNPNPEATIGIDRRPDTAADVLTDLENGLLFVNESIDPIYAFDVLEHIGDGLLDLMTEAHRTLVPAEKFAVQVPALKEDPPSENPHHRRSFNPDWFYSWDPDKSAHVKWDNFTCVPFHVDQTERIYYDSFPQRYYRVRTREFTLTRRSSCGNHPTVTH